MIGLILTLLIAYGGAVVALFRPLVGLFAYTLFSIIRPQLMFGWAGDVGQVSQISGVALLVGWALQGGGNWRLGRAWRFVILVSGYLATVALSAVFAARSDVGWGEVIERAKVVVPFIAGLSLLTDRRWLWAYAWLLVLASGYVAFEMHVAYYIDGYNRALEFGLLGDNNSFAISMVVAVGPALFLGLATRRWWLRGVAFLCAALIMHTTIMTYSRGGLLALIITGVVVAIVMPKRPSFLLALVLAAALGVRLTGPQIAARFQTTFADEEERDGSAQSRIIMWGYCLELIGQSPLVGIGPRHFPIYANQFGLTRGKSAHSLWLQTGAEIGVPGLLFLFTFFAAAMLAALRLTRSGEPRATSLGLYVFSGLAGFVVAAQFVSLDGLELPYYIVLVGAGAVRQRWAEEQDTQAAIAAAPPGNNPVWSTQS